MHRNFTFYWFYRILALRSQNQLQKEQIVAQAIIDNRILIKQTEV